jgi:hypothetical protein
MIPVDYELGRQYQLERVRAASSHRFLRQVVARGHSHVSSQPLRDLPTARPIRVWIARVVAPATRRVPTQLRSSTTT